MKPLIPPPCLPHADVRAWLQTWGTSGQEDARDRLDAVEESLRAEARPCHEFVRVTWSPRARRELDAQHHHIAREQPAAANRIAMRIVAATDRLAAYPLYGRAAPWDVRHRLRELPIAGTPFVVLYTIDTAADEVVIVRVVYGAQLRGSD